MEKCVHLLGSRSEQYGCSIMSRCMPVLVKRCKSVMIWVKSLSTVELESGGVLALVNLTELAPEEFTACSICIAEQHVDNRTAVRRAHTTAVSGCAIMRPQLYLTNV